MSKTYIDYDNKKLVRFFGVYIEGEVHEDLVGTPKLVTIAMWDDALCLATEAVDGCYYTEWDDEDLDVLYTWLKWRENQR